MRPAQFDERHRTGTVAPLRVLGHAGLGPAQAADDDRLLEARDVAALLRVPVSWVYAQSRSGRLPTVQLGRYKRYRRGAIEAFVAEQERGGAEGARPLSRRQPA